jgi:hypothetical protein
MTLAIQEINHHEDPVLTTLKLKTLESKHGNKEDSLSALEQLKRIEEQLLIEKRQIIDNLDKWQHVFDRVADKKNRLTEFMEKKLSCEQQKSEGKACYKLFTVVAHASSWDALVFSVMAESDVWAEEMVRQWLSSNGRENYKIDQVVAVVSQDVRVIVNVGAKLLEV